MGVAGGGGRETPSADDRPAGLRQDDVGLQDAEHHVPAYAGGTARSGVDTLPVRHAAALWHLRYAPFEAPHHTASTASLVGGGSGLAMPGAITRAHRGILFMDEAPEFSARTLQTLREPMESGYVALSRTKGTTYYPARFQMVMAANPCPCGYAYGNGERCVCKEKDRIRYFARLSGPILDRIDIQVEVPPVPCIASARPAIRLVATSCSSR